MENKNITGQIEKLIEQIEKLVPEYMQNPIDKDISKGVCSVCIIDEDGKIYGKVFGSDKLRCRDSFKIAWTKASQVCITGYKTNEFERLVFSDKIDYRQFGINMPDMIGWEGGQPVVLKDGTKLSIGFSGFRGTSDIEIVLRAVEAGL
jgi:glc operon protein GlcG